MCTELKAEKITFPYFYISAFYCLTDILTDEIFVEYIFIYNRNVNQIRPLEKNSHLT